MIPRQELCTVVRELKPGYHSMRHTPVPAVPIERLSAEGVRLVTTDYVIDEACTLAKARSGFSAAARILDVLDATAAVDLEWIGSERFDAAKRAFRKFHDQEFSFTDFTGFVVMRERWISNAVTTGDHFRVAGFEPLLV